MGTSNKYGHLTETEYLYGIKVGEFINLPYGEAVKLKHKKGRELYEKLYEIKAPDFEDEVRTFKVRKALLHNEKLIREWENW